MPLEDKELIKSRLKEAKTSGDLSNILEPVWNQYLKEIDSKAYIWIKCNDDIVDEIEGLFLDWLRFFRAVNQRRKEMKKNA